MNTPAFRLGYMSKIAELAKSPVRFSGINSTIGAKTDLSKNKRTYIPKNNDIPVSVKRKQTLANTNTVPNPVDRVRPVLKQGAFDRIMKMAAGASMSAEDYARRGIKVPWAKTQTQLANPAPSMTPEQYASRGIKPFAPRRTAAGLTEMMNRHLDEGDAAADSFISEGASGEQADDTYMREQARQDQANRDEIAEYMAGMSPEDRSAFLAQKAKTPEGTVAVGRDGKPIESYYAARARQAVSEPGAPVMKTRAQLNAEESAERASRWAGNSTIKWTPRSQAQATGRSLAGGTGTRIITGRGTGNVRYVTPSDITQGFQQSFGKGSAGKDVAVVKPVRRRQVASTTPVRPRNGV